jgi:hypothetical protein
MSNVKNSSALYENVVEVYQTISGAASQNLYQVTGIVNVHYIYGIVDVVIAADVTDAYLEVDDGGAQTVLTLVAGAPDISAAPVGSYLVKSGLAGDILEYVASTTANASEVTRSTVFSEFVTIQKTGGVATYIRLAYAGAGATGKIHWRCKWEKMSRDATLVAA